MIMAGEDLEFKESEAKRQKRRHDEVGRLEKAKQVLKIPGAFTSTATCDIDSCTSTDVSDEDEAQLSLYHHKSIAAKAITPLSVNVATRFETPKLNRRSIIDDPLFIASLDRTNTTPR